MRAILRQEFLEGVTVDDIAPFNTWCSREALEKFNFPSLGNVTLGVVAEDEGGILDTIAQREEKRLYGPVLDLVCGKPGAVPLTFGDFSQYRGRPVPEIADQIRALYQDARNHFYPAERLWVPVPAIERITEGFYLDPVLAIDRSVKAAAPVAS